MNSTRTEVLREAYEVAAFAYARLLISSSPLVEDLRLAEERVLNAAALYGRLLARRHEEACLEAIRRQVA